MPFNDIYKSLSSDAKVKCYVPYGTVVTLVFCHISMLQHLSVDLKMYRNLVLVGVLCSYFKVVFSAPNVHVSVIFMFIIVVLCCTPF